MLERYKTGCNCGISSLHNALFSTLDIDEILNKLTNNICMLIPFGNLRFSSYCGDIVFSKEKINVIGYKYSISHNMNYDEFSIGEFSLFRDYEFRDDEKEVFGKIIDLFAIPLKNAIEYYKALKNASTDNLTGIKNRASFDKEIKGILEACFRKDRPVSVIMADIDHFKKINDTYGHVHGDLVIKTVAQTIKQNIRLGDHVYRYGGEEFIIVFPETNVISSISLSNRILAAIRGLVLCCNHMNHKVTISMGGYTSEDAECNVKEFIKYADEALYISKKSGRDMFNHHIFQNA